MDLQVYIDNLSLEEQEIELIVRGLNFKAQDAIQLLVNSLVAEQSNNTLKPHNSHAKLNPQDEMQILNERYNELFQIGQQKGASPPIEFVASAFAKAKHYKGRVDRMVNTFGETGNLTNLASNMRRVYNWYAKLYREKSEIIPPRTDSSQTGGKSADLVEDMISYQQRSSLTADENLSSQSQAVINEEELLKDSVREFFSKIDVQKQGHREKIPNTAESSYRHYEPNYTFGNSFIPRNIQKEQLTSQANSQTRQFQVNNSYKIKQNWNLSFDGSDTVNVHDFIHRLEQMARDDGYPEHALTKSLHLFLSKKAEDWYWVYKLDHPNAEWSEMKSAILSYFSSYDFEDEIREQILRKYQQPRESFSDFALSVQKLNTRLQNRLSERELIYRLCQNMTPALKNVTLASQTTIRSLEELRVLCQRYEKMWQQTGYDPRQFSNQSTFRRRPIISEVIKYEDNIIQPMTQMKISNQEPKFENNEQPLNIHHEIDALNKVHQRTRFLDTNNNLICWNCKDLGHRYQDCVKPFLNIFCFGCGAANVRKPNCQHCIMFAVGNQQPGVLKSRVAHSEEKTII